MKKIMVLLFAFFFVASFAAAMEDSVTVKTSPGNQVKVYAWPYSGGPLLNVDKGIVNDSGEFVATFFSLNEALVDFQIIVIKPSGEKIRDEKFDDFAINSALYFDCSLDDTCTSVDPSEVIEGVVGEASEGNEPSEEESAVEETQEESTEESAPITGNAVSLRNEDGSFNALYPGIGVVVFALILLLGIVMSRGRGSGSNTEEKELKILESRVKEKEGEITRIKTDKERKGKIEEAKKKIVEEDQELSSLTGAKTTDQKIKEAENKMNEQNKTINDLNKSPSGNVSGGPSPSTEGSPSPGL